MTTRSEHKRALNGPWGTWDGAWVNSAGHRRGEHGDTEDDAIAAAVNDYCAEDARDLYSEGYDAGVHDGQLCKPADCGCADPEIASDPVGKTQRIHTLGIIAAMLGSSEVHCRTTFEGLAHGAGALLAEVERQEGDA